jgi:hypothetical protein
VVGGLSAAALGTPYPACALSRLRNGLCGPACRDDGPHSRVGLRVPTATAGHSHARRLVARAGLCCRQLDVMVLSVQQRSTSARSASCSSGSQASGAVPSSCAAFLVAVGRCQQCSIETVDGRHSGEHDICWELWAVGQTIMAAWLSTSRQCCVAATKEVADSAVLQSDRSYITKHGVYNISRSCEFCLLCNF